MKHVVLIDDTDEYRTLLKAILEGSEFKVVGEAGDGEAGIEVVQQKRPDIVVLDLRMPVLDGFGALPALQASGAKVLVLTGFKTEAVEKELMKLGARSVMEKGAEVDELIEALGRM